VFDVKKILSSSLLQAVGLSNGVKNPSYHPPRKKENREIGRWGDKKEIMGR